MLIEQPAHIGRGHRRHRLADAEPGEMQPRAVIVVMIDIARGRERRNRPGVVAQRLADGRERKPGGGEGGRRYHQLGQNFSRSRGVAAPEAFQRVAITLIGGRIAGGNEKLLRSHDALLPHVSRARSSAKPYIADPDPG